MMKRSTLKLSLALGLMLGQASAASAVAAGFPRVPVRRCAADAVVAGTVCLDRY